MRSWSVRLREGRVESATMSAHPGRPAAEAAASCFGIDHAAQVRLVHGAKAHGRIIAAAIADDVIAWPPERRSRRRRHPPTRSSGAAGPVSRVNQADHAWKRSAISSAGVARPFR